MYINQTQQCGLVRISDPASNANMLIGFIFAAIGIFMPFIAGMAGIVFGLISAVMSYLFFKISKFQNEGFVIDLENDYFEFCAPYEVNGVFDKLNPAYWDTQLKRTRVKLSEIKSLSETEKVYVDNSGKVTQYYRVGIAGNFGAYEWGFLNSIKRDEISTHIIHASNLGDPVVVR